MAFCSKFVLFLSLCCSNYTWSSLAIEFGSGVVLLAANGEAVEDVSGLGGENKFVLPDGINQLVVQMRLS